MKSIQLKPLLYSAFICVVALSFYACSKSKDSASTNSNDFNWLHGGTYHTAGLDTAFVSGYGFSIPPYTLIGGYPRPPYGIQVRVQFTLSSFNVGTYSINANPPSPNSLEYFADDGSDLVGTSGVVSITANNGNYLSGSFSVTVKNASSVTSQLSGGFTNMPIKP